MGTRALSSSSLGWGGLSEVCFPKTSLSVPDQRSVLQVAEAFGSLQGTGLTLYTLCLRDICCILCG